MQQSLLKDCKRTTQCFHKPYFLQTSSNISTETDGDTSASEVSPNKTCEQGALRFLSPTSNTLNSEVTVLETRPAGKKETRY